MSVERFIGRGLAFCVYPAAAWRVLPASGRALVVGAYLCAGFVTTLLTLLMLGVH